MRIKTLSLTDFRAFPGPAPTTFELDGKNLLVYGENGSGKSSLFHALREFFRPNIQSIDQFKNQFTLGNGGVCSVDVIFSDGTNATWSGRTLRVVPATKRDDLVGAALRSSALDYRAILDTNYLHNFDSNPCLTAADDLAVPKRPRRINLFRVAVDSDSGNSLDNLLAKASTDIKALFAELRERIVAIDDSIAENPTAYYVGYRMGNNFAEVHISKNQLKIHLRPIDFVDPKGMVDKIPDGYNWTMDRRVYLKSDSELEYVVGLIEQSYQNVIYLAQQKARQVSTWRALSLVPEPAYLPSFKKSSPLPSSSSPALE